MRDNFPKSTIAKLAKRVAFRCSNPECHRPTSGPQVDSHGTINIGVASHISAASPGGPRYDEALTAQQRASQENGIWLCQTCAKVVDSDLSRFTKELLKSWKRQAELRAEEDIGAVKSAEPIAVLERVLAGHTNYVWDVVVTPDGRRVLSASNDATIRMWDIFSGSNLATFKGHTAFVCSVCVSRDGNLVAAGAADGAIKVWNLHSGHLVHELHHGALDAKVAFGPTVAELLSGGADGHLRQWSLQSRTVLSEIEAHSAPVLKVLCLDDGERALSVSGDRTAKLWNLKLLTCIHFYDEHRGEVNSVAVTEDQRLMVSVSEDRTIKVWNLASGECLATMYGHDEVVWRVAISPDGRLVASGSADNTVRVWDIETYRCVQELPHPDCVAAVTFSPKGDRLVVGCDDHKVYVYGLRMGVVQAL